MDHTRETDNNGESAAAFVAAGIGCAVLGLFTTLAEISVGVKNLLNWWDPAGPLSGKTSMAVAAWIVGWIILHMMWKERQIALSRSLGVTLLLIGLGAIGTFPTFFLTFSH